MSLDIIHPFDMASWPDEICEFLISKNDVLRAWEGSSLLHDHSISEQYDNAISGLSNTLKKFSLHGYHCTRLTDEEAENVLTKGLLLLSDNSLADRIRNLHRMGSISQEIADLLATKNYAKDESRAGKVWFCFFKPNEVHESGIDRFLRFWGGEALYNSYEQDSRTIFTLRHIGTPCLIEARVPINAIDVDSLSI